MLRRQMGSYFETPPSAYQPPPAGTPGWSLAPVPGWGTNPMRAGPARLATNGALSGSEDANQGYIAIAAAGGIFFGWFLAWAYWYNKNQKKT